MKNRFSGLGISLTLLFLSLPFLQGEQIKKAEAVTPTPVTSTLSKNDNFSPQDQSDVEETQVRWCGHAFIYLTSSTGVRIAIDPFGPERVKYAFPNRLPADVILISSEAEDHSSTERLFGTPQVFRSVTAVGLNKANGLLFRGVEVNETAPRDPDPKKSTAFVFTLDGVTFAHLGSIGYPLSSRQKEEIGSVDVLFLPVGNPALSPADLAKIEADLKAKIVVPISYLTPATTSLNLRTLDSFLAAQSLPVKRLDSIEFPISKKLLPDQPALYILNQPAMGNATP